jgi:hypothetical protein
MEPVMFIAASRALAAALALCTSGGAPPPPQDAAVSGVVFHDLDLDGIRGEGEPGLPGVLVSDGRRVAVTDETGRWTLPSGEDQTLFVIAPARWRSPVSSLKIPQFFHLHREAGSPPLEHEGIAPTGPLPASVDFPLEPAGEGGEARVLVVADPQPHNVVHVDYYRQRIVERARGETVDFGIVLGDVVRNDLSLFEPYLQANADMPAPMFHVVGNHDVNADARDETLTTETYQRHFGPPSYGFFHGGSKSFFLVLNNIRAPLDDGSGRAYRGGFSPQTLEFADGVLRHVPADHRIVLATHIPLFSDGGPIEPAAERERRALFDLLEPFREVIVLSGHTHTQHHVIVRRETAADGLIPLHQWVVGTASGSWWGGEPDADGLPDSLMRDGTPPGYGVLTLSADAYVMDYRTADGEQMRVHLPRHMTAHERDVPLYVNVFNGSERTQVAFRVLPGGDWLPLRRTVAEDPHYAARTVMRDLSDAPPAGTRLPPAQPSHHLWHARVPRTLPPGRHRIEVRAIDMWGREIRAEAVIQSHAPVLPYGRITPDHVERYADDH